MIPWKYFVHRPLVQLLSPQRTLRPVYCLMSPLQVRKQTATSDQGRLCYETFGRVDRLTTLCRHLIAFGWWAVWGSLANVWFLIRCQIHYGFRILCCRRKPEISRLGHLPLFSPGWDEMSFCLQLVFFLTVLCWLCPTAPLFSLRQLGLWPILPLERRHRLRLWWNPVRWPHSLVHLSQCYPCSVFVKCRANTFLIVL